MESAPKVLTTAITRTSTTTITHFTVTVQNLVLFTEATLYVRLYSGDDFNSSLYIKLEGADYTAWDSQSDEYINTFVTNWLTANYQ